MRCLTLADVLKGGGAEIHFICRSLPAEHQHLATQRGVKTHNLPTVGPDKTVRDDQSAPHVPWLGPSWREDAETSFDILSSIGGVDLLVIDHYGIDARWERLVRDQAKKILILDDLADRAHDGDFLVDQNLYVDQDTRYKQHLPERTQCLLGPRYALLRPPFIQARQAFPRAERPLGPVNHINVCFGGADNSGETIKALEALMPWLKEESLRVDVIVPAVSPHREALRVWERQYSAIAVHVSPDNIAELLAIADIGLGASGSMTWERACVGLPSLAMAIAPNQQQLGENAGLAGIHLFVGKSREVSVDRLRLAIDFLVNSPHLRHSLAVTGMRFVDGRGVQRVARHVLMPEVFLRQASMEDFEDVFVWRNAAINRHYAHHDREISYEEHRRWFEEILQTKDRFLLIGSDESGPVGVLRYDYQGGCWFTSVYLVPDRHGEGLGTPLLLEGLEWLKSHKGSVTVCAEIRPENTASEIIFERAGFRRKFSTFVIEVIAP